MSTMPSQWMVAVRAGASKARKGVVLEEIFSKSQTPPDKDADINKTCQAVSGQCVEWSNRILCEQTDNAVFPSYGRGV